MSAATDNCRSGMAGAATCQTQHAAAHQPLVVPQGPQAQEQTSETAATAECEVETAQARPQRRRAMLCAKWTRRHRARLNPEAGAANQRWTGAK